MLRHRQLILPRLVLGVEAQVLLQLQIELLLARLHLATDELLDALEVQVLVDLVRIELLLLRQSYHRRVDVGLVRVLVLLLSQLVRQRLLLVGAHLEPVLATLDHVRVIEQSVCVVVFVDLWLVGPLQVILDALLLCL